MFLLYSKHYFGGARKPASVRELVTQDLFFLFMEKGRDLTQSYDKSSYTHRKIQKAT